MRSERSRRPGRPGGDAERRLLTGWGRTAPTAGRVVAVSSAEEVMAALAAPAPRGVLARGLGRAYGDAAQNAGGVLLDLTGLDGCRLSPDGLLVAGGGTSIDDILAEAVPRGWFVPVTPGTRQVTVGGALAADVHGKNHHVDGTISAHVESILLATPVGLRRVGPSDPVFAATAGGMGLTGVVVEATIQMLPVETSLVAVDTDRTDDLDATLALMSTGDQEHRYSVAWIDCLTPGRALGRAVITRGDHATAGMLPPGRKEQALEFRPRTVLAAPPWSPSGLLNPVTIRAFNEAWFRRAPRQERASLHPIGSFFHPLDGVAGWNRLYGRRGFLQYQFIVPFGREDALQAVIERLAGARCPTFLGVLKRFGSAGPGHLSFPAPGWTLALDMPVGSQDLAGLLDELDRTVAGAGGRVYLAKDSRLHPELMATMYPRLDEWRAVRASVDPGGVLSSDLSRRLGLLAKVEG